MLKTKIMNSWQKLRRPPSQPVNSTFMSEETEFPRRSIPPGNASRSRDVALFAKAFLVNPRAMGAALPSSSSLCKAIAASVPIEGDGLILELGAGTGSVTEAMLQRGIDPQRLVVVELSSSLAAHLRRRFPHLRIIEGDAIHLRELLAQDYQRVDAVISGLPLRSLPPNTVYRLMRHYERLLRQRGILVQFTYDLRPSPRQFPRQFTPVSTKIIWQNVPPAKVLVFRHQGENEKQNGQEKLRVPAAEG